MVEIRGISRLFSTEPTEVKRRQEVQENKRPTISDRVEISAEAKATVAPRYTAEAQRASDVRQEVVDQARRRVEDGTYHRPEVVRQVAERVLDDLA